MSASDWRRDIRGPGAPDRGPAPRTGASPSVDGCARTAEVGAARWCAWAPKIRRQFGSTHREPGGLGRQGVEPLPCWEMTAAALIEEIVTDLAPVREQLLSHPYLAAVEGGLVDLPRLRPFAGEQHAIISSDLRSVALLVSRFGGDFFLGVLDGERAALDALGAFADALGMGPRELEEYEPLPGAHAYAGFMAGLGAQGSDAAVAAAYLVN